MDEGAVTGTGRLARRFSENIFPPKKLLERRPSLEFRKQLKHKAKPPGQTVVLEADIIGQPRSVKWYKDGVELRPNHRIRMGKMCDSFAKNLGLKCIYHGFHALFIDGVDFDDSGTYSVTAYNDEETISSRAVLKIVNEAEISELEAMVKIKPELFSSDHCIHLHDEDQGIPHDCHDHADDDSSEKSNEDVRKEDGFSDCSHTDSGLDDSINDVVTPPPPPVDRKETLRLELAPIFESEIREIDFVISQIAIEEKKEETISPISPRNTQSIVQSFKTRFRLESLLAPTFISQLRNKYIIEGCPVIFDCKVLGAKPLNAEWFHNGAKIDVEAEKRFKLFSSKRTFCLIISVTRRADMGQYVCVARNSRGVANSSAILDFADDDFKRHNRRKALMEANSKFDVRNPYCWRTFTTPYNGFHANWAKITLRTFDTPRPAYETSAVNEIMTSVSGKLGPSSRFVQRSLSCCT